MMSTVKPDISTNRLARACNSLHVITRIVVCCSRLQSPVNAATMIEEIESAIFSIVLADYTPKDENEQALFGLTGDGSNRWFDKGLIIEMFRDNTMAIGNMEHSAADATHFNIMSENCLQMEEFDSTGFIIVRPGEEIRSLAPPKRANGISVTWQCCCST